MQTMLIKNTHRILLALGALVTGLASPLALAQAATGCAALAQWPSTLEVRQGQHQQLQLPVPVTRIAVGNPEVGEARLRSEERRVGKECRSRWSRYHEKKKLSS